MPRSPRQTRSTQTETGVTNIAINMNTLAQERTTLENQLRSIEGQASMVRGQIYRINYVENLARQHPMPATYNIGGTQQLTQNPEVAQTMPGAQAGQSGMGQQAGQQATQRVARGQKTPQPDRPKIEPLVLECLTTLSTQNGAGFAGCQSDAVRQWVATSYPKFTFLKNHITNELNRLWRSGKIAAVGEVGPGKNPIFWPLNAPNLPRNATYNQPKEQQRRTGTGG